MSPKTVDKDERRRAIALAALEVFAKQGIEATLMSQIAEAAGIGKGTIYEYFQSKMELILFAAIAWVEAIEVGVEAAIDASADPEARLRQLCLVSMDAFFEDPSMFKLFVGFIQIYFDDPEVFAEHDLIRRISAPMRKAIVGILLDGVSQGVFRPEIAREVDKIAINLFGYLDGIGFHYMINPTFIDLKAQVEFFLDNLLRSIRARDADGREPA